MLQLERPLVFLDLETTGLDRESDRIVSLALLRVENLHTIDQAALMCRTVNPLRPIPAETTAIHGFTDEMVADCPPFSVIAQEVLTQLQDADVAGFGSNYFDVPLLHAEFSRCGLDWTPGHLIDVGTLFKIQEPRSLEAAVQFYLKRHHTQAHRADGDVLATLGVFRAQLRRYQGLIPETVAELAIFTNYGHTRVDLAGKFYLDSEGVYRYGFGRHKDKPVYAHPDFLYWMVHKADLPADTHRMAQMMLDECTEPETDNDLSW